MPSIYDQILVRGTARYRKDKSFIAKAKIPEVVLQALTLENMVDENGIEIIQDKSGSDYDKLKVEDEEKAAKEAAALDGDEPEEQPAVKAAAPAVDQSPTSPDGNPHTPEALPSIPEGNAQRMADTPARKFKSMTPQSEPGMGFPRKNGKTVDIFDGVTPHTHTRLVGGHAVPLSAESFKTRTDAEIVARLIALGKTPVDYNKYRSADDADENDTAIDADDGLSDDSTN